MVAVSAQQISEHVAHPFPAKHLFIFPTRRLRCHPRTNMPNTEPFYDLAPLLQCRSASSVERWFGSIRFDSDLGAFAKERMVGILSSHSSRNQFANAWWQRRLQATLRIAKAQNARILFAADSPSAEAIRHACTRLSVRYVELQIKESHEQSSVISNGLGRMIRFQSLRDTSDTSLAKTPISDRAVAFLSDILIAIHIRPKGKLLRIVEARMSESNITPGSTWVAMHPTPANSQRRTEQKLSETGAILWMFHDEEPEGFCAGFTSPWGCHRRSQPATLAPVLKAPSHLIESDAYLIHCTRSRQGPWPDQSFAGFLDEALRLEQLDLPTPASTLARILTQQRITATNHLKRGELTTSCWSARPLGELLSRRSFQPHLSRWDWEPFGIAVRTQRLMDLGARPVTYLRESVIRKLSAEEQPFTQPEPSRLGDRDWTEEREWRVAGDLRLHSIHFWEAFVFTPNLPTAMQLAPISRWPVCFLE